MNTIQEIKQTLARLPLEERQDIAQWLRIQMFRDSEQVDRVEEPTAAYGALPQPHLLTPEEYLDFEATTTVRHEYVAGEIFAMADPTLRHESIASNVQGALYTHLRGGPCRAFAAGVRVHIKVNRADIFYYPDALVVCGKLDLDGRFIQNPKLLVEVLSPSTERTDRREKALNYRQIPELEEYVLVAQREREVTIYRRSENWQPHVLTMPTATAELRSIELTLPLDRIYEGAF